MVRLPFVSLWYSSLNTPLLTEERLLGKRRDASEAPSFCSSRLFFLIRCWRSFGLFSPRYYSWTSCCLDCHPKPAAGWTKTGFSNTIKNFVWKVGLFLIDMKNVQKLLSQLQDFCCYFFWDRCHICCFCAPKGQGRYRFFNNCKYILWGVVFFASLYFLRWFGPRNPTNPFLASYFWKKQIFEDRLAFESSENAFTANWEEMSSFARKPRRSCWKVPIPMHTNKSENEYYRVLKDMQDFVTKKC